MVAVFHNAMFIGVFREPGYKSDPRADAGGRRVRGVSLLASFYFGSNHFDVVGCDDAAFLQYQFDAFAQFGTCCGCEERGCGSAYGSAEYECEKTFHVVGTI